MRWSMIALMSLGLVVNGCGGATDAASVCDPGESQSCSCTLEGVSTPGERICRQGGAEWTECHCSGDTPDASGSGGDTPPSTDVSGPGSGSSDITAAPQDATTAPDTTGPTDPDTTDPDAADPGEPDATEEPDTTVCVPDCAGKTCGEDGCGGTCGTCEAGWTCEAGACQAPPPCTSDDDCAAISAAEACWTYTCILVTMKVDRFFSIRSTSTLRASCRRTPRPTIWLRSRRSKKWDSSKRRFSRARSCPRAVGGRWTWP